MARVKVQGHGGGSHCTDKGDGLMAGPARPSSILRPLSFLLCAGVLLALGTAAWGQDFGAPKHRARGALSAADDSYKRGDYEAADMLLGQVQALGGDLSQPELEQVRDLKRRNDQALNERRNGAAQLQQAEDAFAKGRRDEAGALVRVLNVNPYLRPADKQRATELTERLRSGSPGGPPAPGTKEDARTLTEAARSALQRGDLDRADQLARQAEKVASGLPAWVQPWRDNPSRVLRDVQAARKKQADDLAARSKPRPGEKPEAGSPLMAPIRSVQNLFKGSPAPKDQPTPKMPAEEARAGSGPAPGVTVAAGPAAGSVTQSSQYHPQEPAPSPQAAQAADFVRKGRAALANNDLVGARRWAEQAQALHATFPWWSEDTPEKLLADVRLRTPAAAQAPPAGVVPNQAPAAQAARMPAAQPARKPAAQAGKEQPVDARALVHEARGLFRLGKLDDADRLSLQAAAVPGNRWGLFEDSPEKLRIDIQKARAGKDREESARLLIEAQKAFDKGDLKEAKGLAYRARHLHGPYSVWDRGDRPDRLLSAIQAAEAKGKQADPGRNDSAIAQRKVNEPRSSYAADQKSASAMPPTAALQAKQRALSLVIEANALQRDGKLAEARQKLMQARGYAQEAERSGAAFNRTEEHPSQAMLKLNANCEGRIRALLQRTDDSLSGATAKDLSGFQVAAGCLAEARRLAMTFSLDTGRIDDKAAWLRRAQLLAQGQTPPPEHVPPTPEVTVASGSQLPPTPTDQRAEAMILLQKARLELTAGQLNAAHRLGEQAFVLLRPFGMEGEAGRFLNSVDTEEQNQRCMAVNRKFDEGHDAFLRKDYGLARTVFAGLDETLLSPERQQRLRELSGLSEMQPGRVAAGPGGAVQQAAGSQTTGRASAGDLGKLTEVANAPGNGAEEGIAERFQGLEEILFQKFRVEGLDEQRRAMASAKAKDYDTAIDLLRAYAVRLDGSSLSAERLAMLRRPVERRLDEYRKLKSQDEWEKNQVASMPNASGREKQRLLDKHKKQGDVETLMGQYHGLVREGKYEEARIVALKMKEIDPDNLAADSALIMVTFKRNIKEFEDIKDRKGEMFLHAINNAEDPGKYQDMLRNPVEFDRQTYERAQARKGKYEKIEYDRRGNAERMIEKRLLSHFDFNWKDTPLQQVIDDLHALAQVNVVLDVDALREATVSLEQPLSLKVENMSLKSALNILLKQVRLTYVIKDEALQITTEEHARGKLKVVTYPVADLVVPVENHSLPAVCDFFKVAERHQANNVNWNYGGPMPWVGPNSLPAAQPISNPNSGRGYGAAGNNGQGAPLGPDKPDKTIEDLLIRLITQTIEPNSWTEMSGKGTIQYFPLGLALVINQTQDIQEQIQDLLQALRRLQDLEVAIEMRLVSVSEAFFERMAVNFDLNITNSQTRYQPQLVTQQFAPPGYLNNFQPSGFFSGLTPAGTFTPDLGVPIKNSSFDFSLPPFGGYPGTLGADGGLTLGLAFLSDIQVYMLLDAAQGDRRYNTMQAPKITVFNGQTAFITVTDAQFFLTQINVVPFGSQLVFQPQNSPIFFGVNMTVTPVVSADRRFVRMNLNPTLNNLFSATVPLVPVQIPVNDLFNDNTQSIEPRIFQTFFQQPAVGTISLNTTVVIPDGGTVLLGGLKALSEGRNEFGPPVLSKIPYVNRLFKNVGYGRETQSLMILVTARIIINEEEEQIYQGNIPPIPR